ncbi:MAG: PilZ domain-containing protein [Pseudomonadota bacterium]
MTEQHNRSSERMRTRRPGRIVWDNASRTINCTIKDMSRTGAQIELTDMAAVPETFDLQLPPAKELRPAQIMRRSGKVFGIMFLDVIPGEDGSMGGGVSFYNPQKGNLPGFAPMPEQVRRMLPWAA